MNVAVWYALLFGFICAIDRITKSIVTEGVVYNRGIIWGLFNSSLSGPFLVISALIILVLSSLSWYTYQRWLAGKYIVGEIMVLAGGVSNLCDRLFFGGVIDFIHVTIGSWQFPVFNGADMSIVLGISIMLLQVFYDDE